MSAFDWLLEKIQNSASNIVDLIVRTEPDGEAQKRIKKHKQYLGILGNLVFVIALLAYFVKLFLHFKAEANIFWAASQDILSKSIPLAILIALSLVAFFLFLINVMMRLRNIFNDYNLLKYIVLSETLIAIMFPTSTNKLFIIGSLKAVLKWFGGF